MGECVREGDGNRSAGDRVGLWAICQLLALPVSEAFTAVNQEFYSKSPGRRRSRGVQSAAMR